MCVWFSCIETKEAPITRRLILFENIGGAEGDRTPDLMTASHALSHLSYSPIRIFDYKEIEKCVNIFFNVMFYCQYHDKLCY